MATVDIMGGKARWETHCPHCDQPDGDLDMERIGPSLSYVFRCRPCRATYVVGLVTGPTAELRARYIALLKAGIEPSIDTNQKS